MLGKHTEAKPLPDLKARGRVPGNASTEFRTLTPSKKNVSVLLPDIKTNIDWMTLDAENDGKT